METHWAEATTGLLHGLDTDDLGGGRRPHVPDHATVRADALGPERLIRLAMKCHPAGYCGWRCWPLLEAARTRAEASVPWEPWPDGTAKAASQLCSSQILPLEETTSVFSLSPSPTMGQPCIATVVWPFRNEWQWVGHKGAFDSVAPTLSIPQAVCKTSVVLPKGATDGVTSET